MDWNVTLQQVASNVESCQRVDWALEKYNPSSKKWERTGRQAIGDGGAEQLGRALESNTFVVLLNLDNNGVGQRGGVSIGRALSTNLLMSLRDLDLSKNPIGDTAARVIGDSLRLNTSLVSLALYECGVGGRGGVAIGRALAQNTVLQTLNLGENKIDAGAGRAIGEGLLQNTSLVELDLRRNSIKAGAEHIGRALATNRTLTTLHLRRNQVNSRAAVAIAKGLGSNTALQTLFLGYNSIGRNCGAVFGDAIRSNSSLKFLDIACNNVGYAVVEPIGQALAHNSSLTGLNIYHTKLSDPEKQKFALALWETRLSASSALVSFQGFDKGDYLGKRLAGQLPPSIARDHDEKVLEFIAALRPKFNQTTGAASGGGATVTDDKEEARMQKQQEAARQRETERKRLDEEEQHRRSLAAAAAVAAAVAAKEEEALPRRRVLQEARQKQLAEREAAQEMQRREAELRIEMRRAEAQRAEAQRAEAQRAEARRAEAQRAEARRAEAQRAEAQRAEAQRIVVERQGREMQEDELLAAWLQEAGHQELGAARATEAKEADEEARRRIAAEHYLEEQRRLFAQYEEARKASEVRKQEAARRRETERLRAEAAKEKARQEALEAARRLEDRRRAEAEAKEKARQEALEAARRLEDCRRAEAEAKEKARQEALEAQRRRQEEADAKEKARQEELEAEQRQELLAREARERRQAAEKEAEEEEAQRKRRQQQELVPAMRVKVMLVGQGESGKTSLAKSLIAAAQRAGVNPDLEDHMDNSRHTDGVDMVDFRMPHPDDKSKEPVIMTLWDFAGQEVYYNTHSLFLSASAIHVLVWNPRVDFNMDRMCFWLESIKSRIGDDLDKALVFVVATHRDEDVVTKSGDTKRLLEKFPKLLRTERFFHVSNDPAFNEWEGFQSFSEFSDAMVRAAYEFDGVRSQVKRSWLLLVDRVKELRQHLSDPRHPSDPLFDEESLLKAEMHAFGIDRQEKDVVVELLHNWGVLLRYQDDRRQDDRPLVCFDPHWLSCAVRCLVNAGAEVAELAPDGCVSHDDLFKRLWKDYPLRDTKTNLLRVVRLNELSYGPVRMPSGPHKGKDAELVFALLHTDPSRADWQKLTELPDRKTHSLVQNAWALRGALALPVGLFGRVMVRCVSVLDSQLVKWWQNYMHLRLNDDLHAFVWLDADDRMLRVRVRCLRSELDAAKQWLGDLSSVVVELMRQPLQRGLVSELLVSCPECAITVKRKRSADPGMFELHKILRRVQEDVEDDDETDDDEKLQDQERCTTCRQDVPLASLCERVRSSHVAFELLCLLVRHAGSDIPPDYKELLRGLESIRAENQELKEDVARLMDVALARSRDYDDDVDSD